MKLGLCQMPVTASKTENFATMRRYVRDAAAAGCDLVVLPEMWCCPYSNAAFAQYAEPQGGETWCLLRGTAREYGVWLVAGSVPEHRLSFPSIQVTSVMIKNEMRGDPHISVYAPAHNLSMKKLSAIPRRAPGASRGCGCSR